MSGRTLDEASGESSARREYYEGYWRMPDLDSAPHVRWKTELTRTHPRVLAARAVIDVGCGSGRVLAALRRPGVRLCGVEASADAAESLRARGIEGYSVDLETQPLPFGDGTFDVALCYDVLEHVFSPERLLAEIRRVLAPDGTALLCVPNTLNLFNRLVFLSGEFVDIMDTSHAAGELFSNHVRLFSRALFERLLATQRFRTLEKHYWFPRRLGDARYRVPPWLAGAVTGPRLHERLPSLFALGFLYVTEPMAEGARSGRPA